MIKKSLLPIAVVILTCANAAYATEKNYVLRCPMGNEVASKLNVAQGALISATDKFTAGEMFRVDMNPSYDHALRSPEVFSGAIVTTSITDLQPLKIELANNPVIVTLFTGSYSFISCRYKVMHSEPPYASSDTYSRLSSDGLTSTSDGFFNLEGAVKGGNCVGTNQHVGPNGVICKFDE